MKQTYIQLHPKDNLLVALRNLPAGERIRWNGREIVLASAVRAKHKFTLERRHTGDPVFMYGVLVGKATTPIPEGGLITTENIEHATEDYGARKDTIRWDAPDVSAWKHRTFQGFPRSDGRVGTANFWLVVPLVFCENRNIQVIKAAMSETLGYTSEQHFSVNTQSLIDLYRSGASRAAILEASILESPEAIRRKRVFPNVDGIKFLTHTLGCGGTRDDADSLVHLLAGYITHPNVAGATVLSLGCQNAQISNLEAAIREKDPHFSKPLFLLEQQAGKSERAFIEEAVKLTFTGLMEADTSTRQAAPLSKLVLGLECGGSDGFSGISANPALGYASDLLVALGGTTILSEFPELNGVEQELINRCQDEQLAGKFATIMRTYSARAEAVGSAFKNNPSPGNIRDGLITDAIKSAGAAKKGGTSPITDVLDYTESATKPGLNLLCTPGNDVESTTGLAGSGANIIVFTTGLGTPTGNPVAPVIKMSSNTQLYQKMNDIIDFDAGPIITGEATIEQMGAELLELIIQTASGAFTPAAVRLQQDDFIPWKRGVSL